MKFGVQINNSDGTLYFETGAHVLSTAPQFAAKVGEIAAAWSVAEGLLGCLYASLLETTADDALAQLGRSNARQMMEHAQRVAEERMEEDERTKMMGWLARLDAVREERNRVQHDLWSRRTGDDQTLYAVHVDSFRHLLLTVIQNRSNADQVIAAADEYAANASNAFTLERLERLRAEIAAVCFGLNELFFERESNP